MTDRIRTLTVILEGDYRTDDAEGVVNAIKMVKGVQQVMEGEPIDMRDYLAREVVAAELGTKVLELLTAHRKR